VGGGARPRDDTRGSPVSRAGQTWENLFYDVVFLVTGEEDEDYYRLFNLCTGEEDCVLKDFFDTPETDPEDPTWRRLT
jgi:hypothetical protein